MTDGERPRERKRDKLVYQKAMFCMSRCPNILYLSTVLMTSTHSKRTELWCGEMKMVFGAGLGEGGWMREFGGWGDVVRHGDGEN